VAQFDLMALSSIALLALATYEAYRCWDTTAMVLSLFMLALGLLQAAFMLQFVAPWGAMTISNWTTTLAGMVFCLALSLLTMDLANYARSANILILIVTAAQFLVGAGIVTV
jgi:hypothetical protein